MKRLALMFALLLLLTACGQDPAGNITLPTDEGGAYTGFADIPAGITAADAVKQGWYVIEESTLLSGTEAWQAFLSQSEDGKDAFLRVAHFIGEEVFYTDLYHIDGTYYFCLNNNGDIRPLGKYTYLRALTDLWGNPQKEHTLYVLTDSLELTHHDVTWSWLSSSLYDVTDIPFYWLGFTTYLDNTPVK
jgi:hypothetical protein